jgi:hypothetical protein
MMLVLLEDSPGHREGVELGAGWERIGERGVPRAAPRAFERYGAVAEEAPACEFEDSADGIRRRAVAAIGAPEEAGDEHQRRDDARPPMPRSPKASHTPP